MHLDHAAHPLATMPKTQAELTVTATASAATDTEYGRVVPVSVTITDADGTELARLEERFAIRGRTGAAELTDPPRAGGAMTDNATDTPRRRRRDVTVTAPTDMSAFAVVSGDHNPIHTDRAAALLAGTEIAHRARHVAVGGRAAGRHRHRRQGHSSAGPAGRLDRPASSAWCCRATRSTSASTASESTVAQRLSRSPHASAPIW